MGDENGVREDGRRFKGGTGKNTPRGFTQRPLTLSGSFRYLETGKKPISRSTRRAGVHDGYGKE